MNPKKHDVSAGDSRQ